jgi:hypothetical protein
VQRLSFASPDVKFSELQNAIFKVANVPPQDQLLSATRPPEATYILGEAHSTLRALGLKHGDMLYLIELRDDGGAAAPRAAPAGAGAVAGAAAAPAAAAAAAAAAPQPPHAGGLTQYCKHGPRGRCLHCMGVAPKKDEGGSVDDGGPGPEWLCQHPPTAFCPNCLPKMSAAEEKALMEGRSRCSCDKSKGQECIYCVDKGPVSNANFVPYAFFMRERAARCKFSHPPSQSCASCAPPPALSYRGKPNCPKGHRPWPLGVCLSCAPPNAIFRLQRYRHTDFVSFQDARVVVEFYQRWARFNKNSQRVGILFGRYSEDADAELGVATVRAEVEAVYEPPQEAQVGNRGVRLLADARERKVEMVAKALGLEPVGWIVATMPREGAKYGGKVFMSGSEIRQAARFQARFSNEFGQSRFVTVIVEHAANVEPLAYQVSDQCTALERDGVLTNAEDPLMLATVKPKEGEMVPTVLYKDKPLAPGSEFLPDEFVVKLGVARARAAQALFKTTDFPVDARDPPAIERAVKEYLARRAGVEPRSRYLDFNLLVALATVLDQALVQRLLAALAAPGALAGDVQRALEAALREKRMLP